MIGANQRYREKYLKRVYYLLQAKKFYSLGEDGKKETIGGFFGFVLFVDGCSLKRSSQLSKNIESIIWIPLKQLL